MNKSFMLATNQSYDLQLQEVMYYFICTTKQVEWQKGNLAALIIIIYASQVARWEVILFGFGEQIARSAAIFQLRTKMNKPY